MKVGEVNLLLECKTGVNQHNDIPSISTFYFTHKRDAILVRDNR